MDGLTDDTWDPGEPLSPSFVASELETTAALQAGDFSRWPDAGGGVRAVLEPLSQFPERLFIFRADHRRWFAGYKTISDLVVEREMPGVFCSRIRWHNVLGELASVRVSDSDARLAFEPLDVAARRRAFDAVDSGTEILHPFVKHLTRGAEKTSRPGGWLVSAERAAFLGLGEEHLRAFTRSLFAARVAQAVSPLTAYDPACSTGQFLAEFQALDPARIRTIGQDLSPQMIELARTRLDEVHVGDAITARVAPGSVDILFSRFLNSEVVTTAQARRLLPGLVATLKPDGVMVLLGHSPLLLDRVDLSAAGLHVERATGRLDDVVFQYYLCRRSRR